MGDYSMRDVFRQETKTQVEGLKQGLTALQQHPTNSQLDVVIRALHTIAAAAYLVELDIVAHLAETMKASLIAAQNHSVQLNSAKLDFLLYASNLLEEVSQIEDTEMTQWLFRHTEDFVRAQSAIELNLPHPAEQSFPASTTVLPPPSTTSSEPQPEPASSSNYPQGVAPILSDASLMELFRQEVEEQATRLNNGLIALEAQPDSTQELEALMRSAHSIKGAARIVGLNAAVELAHDMEDCFVAAQSQALTLTPDQIDILFRGVDLLQTLSQTPEAQLPQWLEQHNAEFAAVRSALNATEVHSAPIVQQVEVQQIEAVPTTLNVLQFNVPQSTVLQSPDRLDNDNNSTTPNVLEQSDQSDDNNAVRDRVVRVSAENLNRIVGLAGESMIAANWLQPFADSLLQLKSRQAALSKTLEALQQKTLNDDVNEPLLDRSRRQEQDCRDLLNNRIGELEDYIRRTDNLSDRLYREVIRSQMRPFVDGVQGFPRMVRDLARQLGKQVKLNVLGESTVVDRDILKQLEAPLTHILRNAIDHGLESPEARISAQKPPEGTIQLEAFHRGGLLAITVSDDGRGIDSRQILQQVIRRNLAPPEVARQMSDAELMEFLFLPGFSLSKQVTELSGRGVGLDIAKTMAQEVGGTVRATSHLGKGTSFHFQLPLTLSVVRTLLVEIAGEFYAFPLSRIDCIVELDRTSISVAENRQYFTFNDKNVGLVSLAQVLNLPAIAPSNTLWVVLISQQSATYGLIVDRCLGEQELVVRPLDARLGKVQDVSAAALMGDGSLVLILDVSDLVRSTNILLEAGQVTPRQKTTTVGRKKILVVDDSITVREVERKLLENRGYQVDVAVDGMEGWNAVRSHTYNLVISDIDMPRMNGIELIKQIKAHSRLRSIPVIVVSYRDREDDRLQGLDAGADYYLTKSSFHDDTLIQAVVDLIGQPS
ncbi:hybrid sensor histidine kinase/response regulator [Phormidesmis sp. 146-33]